MTSQLKVDRISPATGSDVTMTSQLKVDHISPATGSEIIIDGLDLGGGGEILQSVNYVAAINASTASGTYVDTGISMGITPQSSSSYLIWSINVPIAGLQMNVPLRVLLNGQVLVNAGNVAAYNSGLSIPFSGVYTNTSTGAKTITVQWYRGSVGSSSAGTPAIGSFPVWGSGAPAFPHINDTNGYIIEVEQ